MMPSLLRAIDSCGFDYNLNTKTVIRECDCGRLFETEVDINNEQCPKCETGMDFPEISFSHSCDVCDCKGDDYWAECHKERTGHKVSCAGEDKS